jgi:hypothetical protein
VRLGLAIRIHHGPKRWIYLPYALLLAGTLLFGLGSEAYVSELLAYVVLLPIFVIQLIWHTIIGWRAAFGGWFAFFFVYDIWTGVSLGALGFLWAIGLLVPLYVFRPRESDLHGVDGAAQARQ